MNILHFNPKWTLPSKKISNCALIWHLYIDKMLIMIYLCCLGQPAHWLFEWKGHGSPLTNLYYDLSLSYYAEITYCFGVDLLAILFWIQPSLKPLFQTNHNCLPTGTTLSLCIEHEKKKKKQNSGMAGLATMVNQKIIMFIVIPFTYC